MNKEHKKEIIPLQFKISPLELIKEFSFSCWLQNVKMKIKTFIRGEKEFPKKYIVYNVPENLQEKYPLKNGDMCIVLDIMADSTDEYIIIDNTGKVHINMSIDFLIEYNYDTCDDFICIDDKFVRRD